MADNRTTAKAYRWVAIGALLAAISLPLSARQIQAGLVNLATMVTGTLPFGNGGTGATSFTAGSIPFSTGTAFSQDNAALFWDATNDYLGLGIAVPLASLHTLHGTTGYSSYTDVIAVARTVGHVFKNSIDASSYAGATTAFRGSQFELSVDPATNATRNISALTSHLLIPSTNSATLSGYTSSALNAVAEYRGTGLALTLQGGSYTGTNASTGNITSLKGINVTASNTSSGTIGTIAIGVDVAATNSSTGTITTIDGMRATLTNSNAAGIVATARILEIANLVNAGQIDTLTGLYIGDLTTGTQTNPTHSIYASDLGALNYFGGSIRFGTDIYYDDYGVYDDRKSKVMLRRAFTTVPTAGIRDSVLDIRLQTKQSGTVEQGRIGLAIAVGDSAAVTNKTVTGAANNGSGLIRITATGHGYATGDKITAYGVAGTTEANGVWTITSIDANTFDLQASTFTNAYVSGGIATNRGLYYGLLAEVVPTLARGGFTGTAINGDDIAGLVVYNSGSGKATDGIYIGTNSAFGSASEYINGIGMSANADYGIRLIGTYATAAIGVTGLIVAPNVQTTATTVASLPAAAAGNKGTLMYVTDSNTAVWGATVAGGGANNVGVQSNGTNWTVVSK